jgi:putative DNA primase/helicase
MSVSKAARGQWRKIFEALAPQLAEAIEAADRNRNAPCPIHNGDDKNFRLLRDWELNGAARCYSHCGMFKTGFDVLMAMNGWDIRTTTREVAEYLGIGYRQQAGDERHRRPTPPTSQTASSHAPTEAPAQPTPRKANNWKHRKLWEGTVPLSDPRAAAGVSYLLNRRIDPTRVTHDVRVHPDLEYFDEDSETRLYYPALVLLIRDPAGAGVNMHRIYMAHDGSGKAPVPDGIAKKLMPAPLDDYGRPLRVMGGAVRLAESRSGVLAIGEGFETCQAFQHATGVPTWCGISKDGMKAMILPNHIHTVIVLVDYDVSEAGQDASHALAKRLRNEQRKVTLALPPGIEHRTGKSWDWEDSIQMFHNADFNQVADQLVASAY